MTTRRVIALAVAAIAAAPALFAQGLGVPPGRWWMLPAVERTMNLSAEQRAALEDVTVKHARAMIDLKAAVDRAELDLRVTADARPFDAAKARAAFERLVAARGDLERERFELLVGIRTVLDADQWEQLKELTRDRMTDRLRQRREPGAPGAGAARRPDF